MKYFIRTAALLSSIGLVSMAAGCATVTGGTTQKVSVKTKDSATDVAGANCVLTNSEGSYTVTTPGSVKVHRAKDDLSVKCTKPGEPDATTTVESSMRKGAIAGDVAWLGVLSVVTYGIDRANGSVFAYPDDITVSFANPEAQQPVASATVPPAASTSNPAVDSTASTNTTPTQPN
jgi:hypothetical protein